MNSPVGGKPETSRYTQALLAAVGAVGIFFLALFLPNGWPRIALAVGVAAFLLYLYLVPRFWYRRIVNTILILWAGAIATPTLFTEAQLQGIGFLRFLVKGEGWAVHLSLCIAFIASLAASLIHEIWKDRATNESKASTPAQSVIENQTNIAGDQYNAQGNMIVAGRDVHTGIEGDRALDLLVTVSKEAGQSQNENARLKERIRQLEEQLAQPQLTADSDDHGVPQPTQEAKELAKLISEDDGPYALALKAIADGNDAQADHLLNGTQQFLDSVQEEEDRAQIKVFMARMENACYAGRYRDALQWCERLEPLAGEDPVVLNNLAIVYDENAKYQKAEPLHKRALAIREKAFGPVHPDVATSLNNLAGLRKAQGKYADAETLYERALAIREKALAPDHPHVAASLNDLARLYRTQKQYAKAELLYKRALAILEKALGPEHPSLATGLDNLGVLYYTQAKYAEAESLYKRALTVREKALGPDHPNVANSLNNLAVLYFAQGKYAEAEPLHKHALAIQEKAFGPDHPDVATTLNNLAVLHKAQDEYAQAERLHKRALTIRENALGPDHPDVAKSLNNLASLYKDQGKYTQAKLLHERALAILEKALGPDHPDVAKSLNNLAVLYCTRGKYAEAEPLHNRALAIQEKALGPDHPDVANSLNNLACVLAKTGRRDEAIECAEKAAKIFEQINSPHAAQARAFCAELRK